MSEKMHDTLVYRLSQILVKLNQGERLLPEKLADEFSVNLRTIQRDLNERFAYLPLEKQGKYYSLDRTHLGALSTKDIARFSELAGVSGLFPALSRGLIKEIFEEKFQKAVLVKGHSYERLDGLSPNFEFIRDAIDERTEIGFLYNDKKYQRVQPYKLINSKGVWYLAGFHNGKVKTFSFTAIKNLILTDSKFDFDSNISAIIIESDDAWVSAQLTTVKLTVAADAARYFKRRQLLPKQAVEEECADGSLRLTAEVAHWNQVIPIIRYWIPHVRVEYPIEMQKEIERSLEIYMSK